MFVNIIGLGRVGLMTAFHLAQKGFFSYAVDKDKKIIQQLKQKQIPFFEPEFTNLLKRYHKKIIFLTKPKDLKYNFISVPTPFDEFNQKMNLKFIYSVLKSINKSVYKKKYVFIRSTLTPGSCKDLSNRFQNLSIAYFPEFFREGYFVEDYRKTKFSVLGCKNKDIAQKMSQFKFPLVKVCSFEEAEILKSTNNFFHGLKISFANEIGRIAKKFQCSPFKIMDLFMKDTELNISRKYLKPGFSFGGPCLKKDIKSFDVCQGSSKKQWILTDAVEKSNEIHTEWVADQILNLKPKTISLLGCSFTGSQTVDYRNSSVLKLVDVLFSKRKKIQIYGVENILENYSCITLPKDSIKQLLKSDVFILGGWTPVLKEYTNQLLKYKGIFFDLLIQEVPEAIKKHSNYRHIYS